MATHDARGSGSAPEDKWQPARLIPTSGIKGVDEQERRATSALLSVMMAVPEFSRALLRKVGAPAGNLRTYIEPPFETEKSKGKMRPDGALVVRRGNNAWRAFVEVKTNTNELYREQIEAYLDIARDEGFDAVITISNQLAGAVEGHPLSIDRKKTRKVHLYHWSWVEILSEAVLQREFRGVSDRDQEWVLGELIAYLEHPQSGAMQFQDMGQYWVTVREAARDGSLRPNLDGVEDVVTRWDQFMQYLCLFLGRDLGVKVTHILAKKEMEPAGRKTHLVGNLVDAGMLDGTLRVQNAVGDITLTASLRARTVTASLTVEAPRDGRAATRVNWLVRQLKSAPDDLRIHASFSGTRSTNSAKLGDLRDDPKPLLLDGTKEPKVFTVSLMREMGTKRGGLQGSFVSEATRLLLDFYRSVVQSVKPWRASPARLPEGRDDEDIATQPANVVEAVAAQESGDLTAAEMADQQVMEAAASDD